MQGLDNGVREACRRLLAFHVFSIDKFIFGSNFGSCFLGPVGSRSGSHFGYNFWDPKLNPKFEPKGLTVCGQNKFLVAVSGQRSAPEDFARRRRTMPFCGEVVRRWIEVKRTHN